MWVFAVLSGPYAAFVYDDCSDSKFDLVNLLEELLFPRFAGLGELKLAVYAEVISNFVHDFPGMLDVVLGCEDATGECEVACCPWFC